MFIWDIFFAIGIALVLTGIFVGIFRRSGPWASYLVFFALIFLSAWAGGVWIAPIGPSLFGVYWVPFLIFGFIFALLLAATVPAFPPRSRFDKNQQVRKSANRVAEFDLFFFTLVIVLAIAIFLGYLVRL